MLFAVLSKYYLLLLQIKIKIYESFFVDRFFLFSFSSFLFAQPGSPNFPNNNSGNGNNPFSPQTIVFPSLSFCNGEQVILDAGECGYTSFEWKDVSNTILGTSQTLNVTSFGGGTYTVKVSYQNGFFYYKSFSIVVNPLPSLNIGSDTSICFGTGITLHSGNHTSAVWSTGETTASIYVTPQAQEKFFVTVTNEFNCSSSDSIIVSVNQLPEVDLGDDVFVCSSDTVVLSPNQPYVGYSWSTSETSSSIKTNSVGTYSLTVTDSNGCKNSDAVSVLLSPLCIKLIPSQCGYTMSALNNILYFTPISGASAYKMNLYYGDSLVGSAQNTARSFLLTWAGFSGVRYNTTYEVRGQVLKNGAWSPLGEACFITTPPIPTPSAWSTKCNIAIPNAIGAKYLYWNTYSGVQEYQIELTHVETGNKHYKNSTTYAAALSTFSPSQFLDGLYNMQVRANSYGVWGNWGPICQFFIGSPNLGEDIIACGESSVTLDAGVPLAKYLWSTGETTQSISVTTSGAYAVTVDYGNTYYYANLSSSVDVSFCEEAETSQRLGKPSTKVNGSTNDYNTNLIETSQISLFPNPANDKLLVSGFESKKPVYSYSVSDLAGREVISTTTTQDSEINIEQLKPGAYLLFIYSGENIHKKRFVKQ